MAGREEIERFHRREYVDLVKRASDRGAGLLDYGDTPAFAGCYEAAARVVGSALDLLDEIMAGRAERGFLPIGGLHHARRSRAGGFCVFNDCGVAIETLRARYGVRRVAYVDVDVHHGDGVYYGFADDPDVWIADIHEDGRFLYPGTGGAHETGEGSARGTKLNLPLPPGAGDEAFLEAWGRAREFVDAARPEIVLLHCGADGLAGDPLAHLDLTAGALQRAAGDAVALSRAHCGGRLLAFGGGGYVHEHIARVWTRVVSELLELA
jgi:acetoin utilization protein AcuC